MPEKLKPKDVLTLLRGELLRLDLEGLGPKAFERAKRASLGARLRGLEDPASLCVALAETLFEGWCPLDAFALLPQIDIAECEAFLRKELDPARLAISIIQPRRE